MRQPKQHYYFPSGDAARAKIIRASDEAQVDLALGVLSETDSRILIESAIPKMKRARVYADMLGNRTFSNARSCDEAYLNRNDSAVVWRVERHLAKLCSMPDANGQRLQILRYRTGQEHVAHLDAFDATKLDPSAWSLGGQRIITAIVYLSDDFLGGATIFPRLSLSITPPKGSAVIFRNVDGLGEPDPLTLHGSAKVSKGEKWVAVRFFHERSLIDRRHPPP